MIAPRYHQGVDKTDGGAGHHVVPMVFACIYTRKADKECRSNGRHDVTRSISEQNKCQCESNSGLVRTKRMVIAGIGPALIDKMIKAECRDAYGAGYQDYQPRKNMPAVHRTAGMLACLAIRQRYRSARQRRGL
jgi:hypothetical protein